MMEGAEYCRKRKNRGFGNVGGGKLQNIWIGLENLTEKETFGSLGHCACCVACTCSDEWVWSRLCNPPLAQVQGPLQCVLSSHSTHAPLRFCQVPPTSIPQGGHTCSQVHHTSFIYGLLGVYLFITGQGTCSEQVCLGLASSRWVLDFV